MSGPEKEDTPPRMLMRMTSPDLVQWEHVGVDGMLVPANSPPASAAKTRKEPSPTAGTTDLHAQETDRASGILPGSTCITAPKGESTIRRISQKREQDDGHGD